jgi:hypothetical protein
MITPTSRRPLAARPVERCLPVIALAGASLLGACYTYQPPTTGTTTTGTDVRVSLTATGSAAMGQIAGPGMASFDGRLERADGDSVVLRVRRATTMRGDEHAWSGERLAISAANVESIHQKRLSTSRTAIAAVAGVSAAVAAVLSAGTSGGGEPPVIAGPPPAGQ